MVALSALSFLHPLLSLCNCPDRDEEDEEEYHEGDEDHEDHCDDGDDENEEIAEDHIYGVSSLNFYCRIYIEWKEKISERVPSANKSQSRKGSIIENYSPNALL